MRKVRFDNWFSDGFVPTAPQFMPRYGDDCDRYEYCECLLRTYRNEGSLSHVFEKMRSFILEKYNVEIIGIRMDSQDSLRFGTMSDLVNDEKVTDPELCKALSDLAGIRINSFYIANELRIFHWKFFIDAAVDLIGEYESYPGINEIKVNSYGPAGWQISVYYEFDEDLFKHKEDGLDMQIASRAYDIYDSKDFLDCDHESMNIRFTSVETECEKVMKPCSEAEKLFEDKIATSRDLTIDSIKTYNDARGYVFLEVSSTQMAERSYNYYTDILRFPPDTTFTTENIRDLIRTDYESYPQYVIRKDNFELKKMPLYGVTKRNLYISDIEFKDNYVAPPKHVRTEPLPVVEPAPMVKQQPEPEPEILPEPEPEPEPKPEIQPEPKPEPEPASQPIFKPQLKPEPRPKPAAQPVQPAQSVQNESIRGYKKTKYKAILPPIVLVLVLAMSRCVHTDVKKYKEDWETIASEYKRVAEPIQESSDPDILYSDIDGTETDGRYSNDYTGVAFDIPEGFNSINIAKSPFNSSTRSADEKIEMSTFCLDEAYYFYDSNQHENIIVDLFYLPGYADQDTSAKFVLIVALNELNSFYESKSACAPATFMGEVKGYVKYYEYSDVVETRTKAIFCTYHNSIATLITINCPTRSDVDKYITLDE